MIDFEKYLQSLNYPASGIIRKEILEKEITKAIGNISEEYKNKKVLMLGCSTGYEIQELKKRGFKNIVGLTYDRKEFKNRKEDIEDNMIRGDMHELPFENDEFDFIYSKEVLEHSIAPYIVLCELNRVIKLGGKFLHYISEGITKQNEWYHLSCFPPYIWIDLFSLTGFKIEKVLSAKNKEGNEIIQSSYFGEKLLNKDLYSETIKYNLKNELKNIKFGELDLLCEN